MVSETIKMTEWFGVRKDLAYQLVRTPLPWAGTKKMHQWKHEIHVLYEQLTYQKNSVQNFIV